MARPTKLVAAAAGSTLMLLSSAALAVGEEGDRIDSSQFTIDLHQGPVLASSRVVGLAGAYAAIAEGVLATQYNPAAVAVRVPWSQKWFDWELDGGFTLPASVTDFDFDNNGDSEFANSAALFVTGGLGFQLGDFGLGLTLDWQLYQLESQIEDDEVMNVSITRLLLVGGYSFLDGELTAGLGVAGNSVGLARPVAGEEERDIGTVTGPTFHGGVLWAPAYASLRIGVSARIGLPASAQPDARPACAEPCVQDGDDTYIPDDPDDPEPPPPPAPSGRFYLPRTISLPNEIYAGVAYQFLRPMNLPWVNPHDEYGAYDRVRSQVDKAREARDDARDKKIAEIEAKGADPDPIEEQLDVVEDRIREIEDERLKEASSIDRRRRLKPYKQQPREKILVTAGMKLTWTTLDGVGLESFLKQQVERSGEAITVQPHGAVEAEVWPGYLVLRGGSYYEPTRFRAGSARVHGTGGLVLRIPVEWSVFGLFDDDTTFRINGAVDGSARYFGWGVGAGIWR